MSGAEGGDTSGGDYLFEYVRGELDKEEARRSSLEARGLSVATAAGGIAALVAAFRDLAGGNALDLGRHGARGALIACIALFVSAALLAALTTAPRRARLVDPAGLRELAPQLWGEHGDRARKMIFASRLVYLDEAQRGNDRRGRLLFGATVLLALGGVALLVAVSVATL